MYKIAEEVGFSRPRLSTATKIGVKNAEVEAIIGEYHEVICNTVPGGVIYSSMFHF